jgi:antitoxin component YwqK of YwqJK toxin-antitoxin module
MEIIATRHPSGEKDITYTRIDNQNVIRQGYYDNGQLRFRQNIVAGYENGEYRSWFKNGQLSVVGQKKMGEGIGKYIYYKPDGRISQVLIFKEDGTSVDVTNEYAK